MNRVDVVVIGAGTAGANVALQLARRGRSVALLERRPIDDGGAQWHNGCLDWQFDEAGLERPAPPERVDERCTTRMVGPDGARGPVIAAGPVVRVDMAALGRRLRKLAEEAGAELRGSIGDIGVEVDDGRVTGVTAGGRRIEARLVVDASGRAAVARRALPEMQAAWPTVLGAELCTAGDHVLRIADRDGARRFLDRHDAEPGDSVTMVGCAGGWSTRAITVDRAVETVAVLVGCVADGRDGTAATMLTAARAAEPWLGDAIESAHGLIPLRRPYARLTAPGLALVGDAANQVFPAHGSGIGMGLMAGTLLAEAAAQADDVGAPQVGEAYEAAFHRRHGGTLAAYDALRRMSTALGPDGTARLLRSGLLDEGSARSGLDQRWATPGLLDGAVRAARLVLAPTLAAAVVPWLARAQVASVLGSRFPGPDAAAIERWDQRLGRVVGQGA